MENRNRIGLKKLVKFKHSQFYEVQQGNYIKLEEEGRNLIAQYYNEKYHANIIIPENSELFNFVENIQNFLDAARKLPGDVRIAFIVDNKTRGIINHTTPIIYIRENNEEGLLYADSLGSKFARKIFILSSLEENASIPVYVVEDRRQVDSFSCHTDALILGRDVTRFDENTKQYYIPDILMKLKSRLREIEGIKTVLLPNPLLKTSQISLFTEKHKQANAEIIHKNLTLQEFLDEKPEYIKEKGIKLIYVMEIQFYLNQIKNIMPDMMNTEMRNKYIQGAKTLLVSKKEATDLYEYTQDFILQLTNSKENVTSLQCKFQ